MTANKALTLALLLALCGGAQAAEKPAETCAPGALGVSRVIAVGGTPRLGLKSYPQTLDLQDHEVVLTFDDGPSAPTPRILATLAAECAKATFFLIGRNAQGQPELARREIAEGHTVGSHSFSHPLAINRMRFDAALADIDRGAAAVDKAAGGKASKFFRFPGFVDSPELLAAVEKQGMAVFGTDLWASDWTPMTPQAELALLMGRLRKAGRGVILLHDIKKQTADMLPALLAALKAEHFRLVHIVPGDSSPPTRPAPPGWTSETAAINKGLGIYGAAPAAKPARPANQTDGKNDGSS
jgi:peptidoglycan/xylan/chitin deacetylase (PgdA/CDA1 family)